MVKILIFQIKSVYKLTNIIFNNLKKCIDIFTKRFNIVYVIEFIK